MCAVIPERLLGYGRLYSVIVALRAHTLWWVADWAFGPPGLVASNRSSKTSPPHLDDAAAAAAAALFRHLFFCRVITDINVHNRSTTPRALPPGLRRDCCIQMGVLKVLRPTVKVAKENMFALN